MFRSMKRLNTNGGVEEKDGLVHKFTNVFSWITQQADMVILPGRVCASSSSNQNG